MAINRNIFLACAAALIFIVYMLSSSSKGLKNNNSIQQLELSETKSNLKDKESLIESKSTVNDVNVVFETEVGTFRIAVNQEWCPLGSARFLQLVNDKFYDNSAFFRFVPKFVVQWGLAADPLLNKKYSIIKDDPFIGNSNKRGTISFATSGANSRTTQVFINFADNSFLDAMGFVPFGVISEEDMLIVENKIYSGYGEQPNQSRITSKGDAYFKQNFPLITHTIKAYTV